MAEPPEITLIWAEIPPDDPTAESLRVTRTWLYPMQAWYCICLFICIIALFQWIIMIPLGLANAYRVIAFRWTLQIGKSHSLTMAEVLVTMTYVVVFYMGIYQQ
jgi:ferric-chelate reductase